jgi:hypothetical protein
MGGVGLRGVGLQPLSDLRAHRVRPVQDRVDSVAQRAKLSSVHRLSPLSRMRDSSNRTRSPARKVCGSRLEVEDEVWVELRRVHARGRAALTLPAPHPHRKGRRSTTAASWMKHRSRSRCMGHRAAPLGNTEAMAS